MSFIRLVEDRRGKRQQQRDWRYITIATVVWFGFVLAMPHVRAWASLGW